MSSLSVHDIQGITAYNNTIRVPTGHTLDVQGTLNTSNLSIPMWTDGTRPTTGLVMGLTGFNTDKKLLEIYGGEDAENNNEPIWYYSDGSGGAAGGVWPDAYQSLIDSFSGTKYYVDPSGNDSNSGTSDTSAWATPGYAFDSAPTGSMIIVLPGTYTINTSNNLSGSSYNGACVWDNDKNLKIVCAPGQTTFNCSNSGARDYHALSLRNNSSAIYGAYIRRDNGGRTNQYSVAFMGFNAGYNDVDGDHFNCVIREINSNGNFSAHYDNSSLANWIGTNSLYMGSNWTGNYSGGGGVTCTDCASNNSSWTTSGTNTGTLTGATVQSNFSTGVSKGVYAGTYAWDSAKTTITL